MPRAGRDTDAMHGHGRRPDGLGNIKVAAEGGGQVTTGIRIFRGEPYPSTPGGRDRRGNGPDLHRRLGYCSYSGSAMDGHETAEILALSASKANVQEIPSEE